MQFEGEVAVITGGASGIGMGLAEQAARRGMRVAIADVQEDALASAERTLRDAGAEVLAVPTDVTRFEQVDALADAVYARFGSVGLLCNNAGVNVTVTRPIWQYSRGDWEWLMGVNLWGVVHGVQAFLPRMRAQKTASHILNTCSSAGVIAGPGLAIYKVTKHGVLSLSETLYHDLANAGEKVGVSVFLPDVVKTGLRDSARNRPAELRDEVPKTPEEQAADDALRGTPGLQPAAAAELALAGVERGDLYVFTSDSALDFVGQRAADMAARVPKPAETLTGDLRAAAEASSESS